MASRLVPSLGARRLATLGGLSFRRPKPPPATSRDAFLALLKRKGVWLEDVDDHPLVLGIPLGRSGGQEKAIAVDVGLKNMASISLRELARASPNVHRMLLDRALAGKGVDDLTEEEDAALIAAAGPVPMVIIEREDLQQLPIATAAHPDSLEPSVRTETLRTLHDPFFSNLSDFAGVVLDAVPDADDHVEIRENYLLLRLSEQQAAQGVNVQQQQQQQQQRQQRPGFERRPPQQRAAAGDRPGFDRRPADAQRPSRDATGRGTMWARGGARSRDCLLYTSPSPRD